jgi:hypothetical protein
LPITLLATAVQYWNGGSYAWLPNRDQLSYYACQMGTTCILLVSVTDDGAPGGLAPAGLLLHPIHDCQIGTHALFCAPNRTTCILLVSVTDDGTPGGPGAGGLAAASEVFASRSSQLVAQEPSQCCCCLACIRGCNGSEMGAWGTDRHKGS